MKKTIIKIRKWGKKDKLLKFINVDFFSTSMPSVNIHLTDKQLKELSAEITRVLTEKGV